MYRTVLLLAVLASALAWRQMTAASPGSMLRSTRDRENMAKTLTMLRQLDDIYAKLSRPRFGKRTVLPPAPYRSVEYPKDEPEFPRRFFRRR